jgi:hypothetical protein
VDRDAPAGSGDLDRPSPAVVATGFPITSPSAAIVVSRPSSVKKIIKSTCR